VGRSGSVYKAWLQAQPEGFLDGVEHAALDPFRGHANAIRDGRPDLTWLRLVRSRGGFDDADDGSRNVVECGAGVGDVQALVLAPIIEPTTSRHGRLLAELGVPSLNRVGPSRPPTGPWGWTACPDEPPPPSRCWHGWWSRPANWTRSGFWRRSYAAKNS
jgi:hypothetical protein